MKVAIRPDSTDFEISIGDKVRHVVSQEAAVELANWIFDLADARTCMTTYKQYKHLDYLLSDPEWLPMDFVGKIMLDLWDAVKTNARRFESEN